MGRKLNMAVISLGLLGVASNNVYSSKIEINKDSIELSSAISGENTNKQSSGFTFTKNEIIGTGAIVTTLLTVAFGLLTKKTRSIKQLKSAISELESTLCKSQKQENILRLKLDEMGNARLTAEERLKTSADTLQTKLNQSQTNVDDLTLALKNKTEELQQADTKICSLELDLSKSKGELITERIHTEYYQSEAELLQIKLKNAENNIEKLRIHLKTRNQALKEANARIGSLDKELLNSKNELEKALRHNSSTEVDDTALKVMEEKINGKKLDYDPMLPPRKLKAEIQYNHDYNEIVAGTTNRENVPILEIPQIKEGKDFVLNIPATSEMKVVKASPKDFKPAAKYHTVVSEEASGAIKWGKDETARDIVQNYFDGSGQTLDGVRMRFTPIENGKYRVRIDGESTYNADEAVIWYNSSKRNNVNAAGNYGEGLKATAIKLLRDSGATEVRYGSNNWKLKYTLEKSDVFEDQTVLTYSLDKVKPYQGSFIEFETTDMELLQELRKTVNRFYHSGNPHFKCPEFENELFGIKLLPKGEKGGIYIAGQRFKYNDSFDGIEDAVIFIKEKIPDEIFNSLRDRRSLNISDLIKITKWLASRSDVSDKLKVFKALDRFQDDGSYEMQQFLSEYANKCNWDNYGENAIGKIKFPDNYIAADFSSDTIKEQLKANGYRICRPNFQYFGMKTVSQIASEAKEHIPLMPNEAQIKKINILKTALEKLMPSLRKTHFTQEELNPKIYLFDAKNKAENSKTVYDNVLGEAITENVGYSKEGVTKGFWLDREYLNRASFSEILETALHELSHRAGGDGTEKFGYKLTRVNQSVIKQIIENPATQKELSVLSKIWEGIN